MQTKTQQKNMQKEQNMQGKQGRGQGGFTLLEVMVAMSILTIGILSVVAIQYQVVNGNTNANVVSQQVFLAQRVMEEYKNNSNPASLRSEIRANVDQEGLVAGAGRPGGPYTVQVEVDNPLGGAVSRFITVTVTRAGGIGGHPVIIKSLTHGNGI